MHKCCRPELEVYATGYRLLSDEEMNFKVRTNRTLRYLATCLVREGVVGPGRGVRTKPLVNCLRPRYCTPTGTLAIEVTAQLWPIPV